MSHASPPTLQFTLVGDWTHFRTQEGDTLAAQIRRYVTQQLGRRDQDAHTRAALRMRLKEMLDAAVSGEAEAVFLSHEMQPGVVMPVVLTVFRPRIIQATSREASGLPTPADALAAAASTRADEWDGIETLDLDVGRVMRTHRIRALDVDDAEEVPQVTSLSAEYWVPNPMDTSLVLVNFFTPLGEIPQMMLRYFDSMVATSEFANPLT